MTDFAEYAALARHLHQLHRAGVQGVEQDAQHRTATGAAINQLGHRLAAQHQRLTGLAQSIGQPPPGPLSGGMSPGPLSGGMPPGPPRPGAALPPGNYAPAAQLALPGQRPPSNPEIRPLSGAGLPYAPPADPYSPADPYQEIELARQAADATDAAVHQAETLAGLPALLPAWSPLARSVGVYAGFGALVAVIHWILLIATGFNRITVEKVSFSETFSLFAWSCGGLPTVAFFAGYLVLRTWGRPRIGTDDSAVHARLGFLICFLATPLAFCAYSLIF